MSRARAFRIGVASVPLALALTACGASNSQDASTAPAGIATSSTPTPPHTRTSTPTPTPVPSASETPAAATGAGADVALDVSGSRTIHVSGHGATASCDYEVPTEEAGVSIKARSTDFPASGDWSLTIQGDDPVRLGLLLAVDGTQFSGNNGNDPASMDQGGTITVSDDVGRAEFDIQLVNIVNHDETVRVRGSVSCR
jgi:hypothetical protein